MTPPQQPQPLQQPEKSQNQSENAPPPAARRPRARARKLHAAPTPPTASVIDTSPEAELTRASAVAERLRTLNDQAQMREGRLSRAQTGELSQIGEYWDAATRKRQQDVLYLWSRGFALSSIAEALGFDRATIRKDVRVIQRDIQRDLLPDIRERIAFSAAVRYSVMQEASQLYGRLEDKSHNKVAALDLVLRAADSIDKLNAVAAPQEVTAATLVEMQEATMEALAAVGGVELQQAVTRYLRDKAALGSDYAPTNPNVAVDEG